MEQDFLQYNEDLHKLKKRFAAGVLTEKDKDAYGQLIEEWERSQQAIRDTNQGSIRDMQVFDRISGFQKEHLEHMSDYYGHKHRTLARLGCAIFYIDKAMATYAKWGDEDLLAELKAKGIRIGSVFSWENLGNNAVLKAMDNPFGNVCCIGEEHYSPLLVPYACFARYAQGDAFESSGVNLIFAPVESLDNELPIFLNHILEQEDISYENKILYPTERKRSDLIEKSATLSKELFCLLDPGGCVVYMSPELEAALGKTLDAFEAPRTPVKDFIPELAAVWDGVVRGRPVAARSVAFKRDGQRLNFFADAQVLEENGGLVGVKILLRTLTEMNALASPLHGSSVVYSFDSIIGGSATMLSCKEQALAASKSDSTVLITGESGTGKELFAQGIHNASQRREKPFVAINCGAIPKELIGSELFGYEEGAFTGAKRGGHVGKVEQAANGTLFLDEIGEMPLDTQVFLLRFLDSGEIMRIGGKKSTRVDVRIIAATNRDLPEAIAQGSFRLDLYYRLNVLRMKLPPLRERTEDLPELVTHFLTEIGGKLGKSVRDASPEALALLAAYPWPGNLRELRNLMERCVNLLPDDADCLEAGNLPPDILQGVNRISDNPRQANRGRPLDVDGLVGGESGTPFNYREYEKSEIERLLKLNHGNKKKVAEQLGITRATLYNRMKRYGMPL